MRGPQSLRSAGECAHHDLSACGSICSPKHGRCALLERCCGHLRSHRYFSARGGWPRSRSRHGCCILNGDRKARCRPPTPISSRSKRRARFFPRRSGSTHGACSPRAARCSVRCSRLRRRAMTSSATLARAICSSRSMRREKSRASNCSPARTRPRMSSRCERRVRFGGASSDGCPHLSRRRAWRRSAAPPSLVSRWRKPSNGAWLAVPIRFVFQSRSRSMKCARCFQMPRRFPPRTRARAGTPFAMRPAC